MPQASDGRIVIDTSLDNTGFEKGSKELISAAKDITNTINKLGVDMTAGFTKIVPILENIANQTTQINSKMATAADEAASTTSKVTTAEEQLHGVAEETAEAVDAQSKSIQDFGEQAQQAVGETKSAIDTQSDAIKDFGVQAEKAVDDTKSAIDSQEDSMQGFVDSTHEAASGMQESTKSVSNFDKELSKIQQKIDATKAKLADYYSETEKIEQATEEMLAKAETDEQARVTNEIADAQLAELNKKYAEQLKLLAELEAEYNRIVALKQQEATTAENTPEPDVEDTEALDKELSGILKKLDQYEAKVAKMGTLGATDAQWESVAYDIEHAESVLDSYREKLEELQESDSIPAEDYERLSGAVGEAALRFEDLKSEIPVSETYSFRDAMKSAASSALSVVGNLAKKGFVAIGKGIKSAVKNLRSFRSESKKSASLINGMTRSLTSLKTMLLSRIKRTFISSIIDTAKAGLGDLAKFDSGFDEAMSNIKNSTKQAGYNLSVSLGAIISAVEPFVTAIANAMNTALTHVNALMSALGGKTTVALAKKQTDSYAKSLDGAANSAKELKNQVYGFDELNKRSNDNTTSASASFETGDIADILTEQESSLADQIKEAIASGDWYGVGETITSSFNSVFGKVDAWLSTVLEPKGKTWATRIGDVLNGMVDGADWSAAGTTIANGLNAITGIYNTFMGRFNFKNLGSSFASSVNGLFDGIKWEQIGQTFGLKWSALINLVSGFVHGVRWGAIGTDVGTGIQSWFDAVDWNALADDAVTGFNGVIAFLVSAITAIDWLGIGSTLGESLEGMIEGIDWANVGSLLSEAVLGLLKLALGLLTGIDWFSLASSLTQGLLDMITNIDWLQILALLGTAIIKLILLPGEIFMGMVDGVAQTFADFFRSIGEDGIAGLFDGISQTMKDAKNWLKQHIVDPIVGSVKSFFGIHSPSTVFAEIGDNLILGLLNGIKDKWNQIPEYFRQKAESLKTTLLSKWTAMKADATNAMAGLKTSVSEKWQSLKTTLSQTEWSSIGSNLVAGLKNGITSKWESLKSSVSSLCSGLVDKVKNVFDINSPSRVFEEIGTYLDEGLENGIDGGKNKILSTVKALADDVTDETGGSMALDVPEDGSFRTLDALTDKLSRIAQIFEQITDTINSLGGFVMPQIAAGSVIPVKTRIETMPTSGDSLDGYADYIGGMDEQMSEEIYLLKQIIAILKTLNLNIDINALTQMITSQQNTRKLNFGGA